MEMLKAYKEKNIQINPEDWALLTIDKGYYPPDESGDMPVTNESYYYDVPVEHCVPEMMPYCKVEEEVYNNKILLKIAESLTDYVRIFAPNKPETSVVIETLIVQDPDSPRPEWMIEGLEKSIKSVSLASAFSGFGNMMNGMNNINNMNNIIEGNVKEEEE